MSIAVESELLFDVTTHNGTITIVSRRTGDHRTVRVHTQPADAEFMPGRRLVSLLTGPDNTSDFRAFGVLSPSADAVYLWRKHKGSAVFEWLAAAILNPAAFVGQAEFLFDGRCRVCNRPLTTPESIRSGIGPVCANRIANGE